MEKQISLIKLNGVSKSYKTPNGRKFILDNVSITLPKDNIAVLGPNGAGKSTLFRLLGGTEYPDSGSIRTRGSISWPVGLTGGFQPSLTGRENVFFVCNIYCLSKQEIKERIKFIEEFTELGNFFDMPVKKYSSGMRARLGFALSLAFEFSIYLVDEITSVGDAVFRAKANEAFSTIYKRSSILMVSHDMQTLKTHCNSAILLNNGKLTYTKDLNAAIEIYQKGTYE